MKKRLLAALLLITIPFTISNLHAEDYIIDTEGMHASINFKIKHVGISWLIGRFDKFNGKFSYDEENPAASKVVIDIDVTSVNSNHKKRDEHILSEDYLNTANHPSAHFESTSIEITSDTTGIIHGDLTLNGVTNSIDLMASHSGGGDDPWGGFRQAFEATTTLKSKDFNYKFEYGDIYLTLYVEGVRQ